MTHYAALLHDLAAHGGRTTYAKLCRRYPELNYAGFTAAAYRARKLGVVTMQGHVIVACGACSCCGRELGKGE